MFLESWPSNQGDEWEEKWGEQYWNLGRANKYADKWGREGTNVWHERWGEDYDGSGGCFKYTDKVCSLCSDLQVSIGNRQAPIHGTYAAERSKMAAAAASGIHMRCS